MEQKSGFLAMIIATVIWGNLVLVFAHIRYVPVGDILAHRVIWGLLTMLLWLGWKGRLGEIFAAISSPRALIVMSLAAFLVGLNWLGFVWAVTNAHALEAGLGYFIFPLVSIAFGAIINKERLNPRQWAAIALAAIGVLVLAFGLGRPPWISLFLATSFASYGLLKSRIKIGAVLSVTIENILLLPIALIWAWGFAEYGLGFGGSADAALWLVISGFMTAAALIGFSYATKTIGLVATGMLFFINPSLQVINAAFILGEPLLLWHKIAFPLIWLACAIYCYDLWRRGRAKNKPMLA